MKRLITGLPSRVSAGKGILLASACIFSSALCARASVTVQGWWHLDSTQPITDSSGNGRTFGSAFSTAPSAGGSVAAQVINNGAGGPLDSSGWTSSQCIQIGVGVGGKRQSTMWGLGYNPPAQNFGIEIWVLPQDNGIAGGSGGWIFSSGQSGGVALRINAPGGNPSYIDAYDVGNGTVIGDQVPINTNQWMHLALVNAGGVTTFYTNGIPCGPSVTNADTASAGDVYMMAAPGDNSAFYGYLDEARMFTFSAGAFTTNDLLLRPPGPNILVPPQNAAVWNGGASPFSVTASFDNTLQYQWLNGGISINEATNDTYVVASVVPADNGESFACKVTSGSLSVTSTPATLTVVTPNAANIAAYRNLVTSDPGLVAYFPVDGCTGSVLTNTVNSAFNGALENDATYDGRTNRSFGQRALLFDGNADVEVPRNSAYEFASGSGTIEALVYMSGPTVGPTAIFSDNYEGVPAYYSLEADPTGSFLLYTNDSTSPTLSWPVPGGLIGRLLHVALVFDHGTGVTPYVNGISLGTQQQPNFGNNPGGSFWIGGIGNSATANRWVGTIDELAIYGTSLSAATIQTHYTKFLFGTNVAPPVIVSQPASKTLLAGGSPVLPVVVSGALPLSYQWTSNGVPIAGATSSTLALSHTTTNFSATYSLTVSNVFGSANTLPVVLTFLAPPAGYVAQVMSDNPTALWRLADTGTRTAADSAGLNDATYTSTGVTYAAGGFPGDPNAGALFDGASGRAVTPANFPDLNPNGPFTIEFWGNLASYGFYVPVGSMDRPARTSGYEFYIDGNSPGYEFHTAAGGGYNMLCADGNVPPNGTWAYVTGVWDTTNLYVYVDGQLGNIVEDPPEPAGVDNWQTEGAPPFNPNTTFPLYIGSRSDNTHFYHGTLCDVAFYNYALTPEQINNHWSFGWVPSAVLSSPPGVTNVEGSTITLTPTVAGVPNTYAWYFNGNPLSDTGNADGTAHYPNDVTNVSLVISEAEPTDSGHYQLVINNPIGNSSSAMINVVVTPNTNPPTITEVAGLGTANVTGGSTPSLVKVVFSNRIDPATGGDPSKYTLSPAVTIKSVTLLGSGANDLAETSLGGDWREAILVTAGLTPGQKYSLTVTGLKDQSQTPVSIPTSTTYFRAPVLTGGALNWDYYYLGNSSGGQVSVLTADPHYLSAPQTNSYLTAFDSSLITGGDLNNNPAFGSLGDNYGGVVSGWITPTVSGSYTFFLWSDDGGELDMSTNSANPSEAVMIAYTPQAGGGFVEPTDTTPPLLTSSPVTMTAGQSYYIQALYAEGGGGDYVKVAWRSATDSTPAKNLQPIPGTFLSTYQPVAKPTFSAPSISGNTLTLAWSGYQAVLQESTDLKTWINVPGNPNPLVVNTGPGTPKAVFYRLSQ